MTVQKTTNRHTLQLVQETGGYGAGGTFTSNAGALLVTEPPAWDLGYQYDGKQDGRGAGTAAARRRVKAFGAKATGSVVNQLRTAGQAYSSSIKPAIHAPLLAAGFLATLDTTGSGFYTYAPADDVNASMAVRSWYGGELTTLVGAQVSKTTFTGDGNGKPMDAAFEIAGILSALDDAGFSQVTYPGGNLVYSIGVALTWLGVTLKTRKWELTHTRELTERVGQWDAAGVHQGFELGARTTQLTCTIEAPARVSTGPFFNVGTGAFDPRRIYEAGFSGALALTMGNAGGNRFSASSASAQLADAAKANKDGAIQLWDLTFDCTGTDEVGGADDLILKFD